jgi:phosphatidylglycerophosphatase C
MPSQTATPAQAVAIFDLDGTLVAGDTLLPFLVSYARSRHSVLPFLLLPLGLALHLCGLWSARRLKEQLLTWFLGGEPMSRIRDHAAWFCRSWVASHLHPVGIARLREHQKAGHRIILLSASPSVYVPMIAAFLGIDEVVCTQVREDEGNCRGQVIGSNCKGAEKLSLLQGHLSSESPPRHSFAYGDSRADLFVLEWVEEGFLVGRKGCHPVTEGCRR